MKEKKWIDCPYCGSKGTMIRKKGIYEIYTLKDYKPIKIGPLEGDFCYVCDEGFYVKMSEKFINSKLAEEKAKQDSERTVASQLLDVDTIAKKLNVTRQRIHQMMSEGKLQYVYVGNLRFPRKINKEQFYKIRNRLRYKVHTK
jgi:DNA-directed RNA polymerase subunit RPC12/RpoP